MCCIITRLYFNLRYIGEIYIKQTSRISQSRLPSVLLELFKMNVKIFDKKCSISERAL